MTRITTDDVLRNGITMGFGKHADKTQDWVARNDPDYFLWAAENVDHFFPQPNLLEDARDRVIAGEEGDSDPVIDLDDDRSYGQD